MEENENELGNIFDAFDDSVTPNENNTDSAEIEIDSTDEISEEVPQGLDVFEVPNESSSEPNTETNEDLQTSESLTTTEHEDVGTFQVDKVSAASAIGNGKPPVLNRKFILTILGSFFSLFIIFSVFIFPLLSQKKEKDTKTKPVPSENTVPDYSSYVEKKPKQEITNTSKDSEQKEDRDIDDLPPVSEKFKPEVKPAPNQSNVVYSGNGKEYPDTSEDSLQSKSISGIKGLTNTQKNYLTNPDSNIISNNTNAQESSTNPYAKFGLPDKTTYAQQMLSAAGNSNSNNSYANQNDQSGKNQFFSNNRGEVSGEWLPLNTIWQGTIFEAVLTSNINTDLPGECTAVVTKNIYSSQDGSLLLIPQNSKLYGSYNSSISYSQGRVQVGWHTLIRPDGYQVSLGNMNATDAQGASGLKGFLNDHPFQYLKAIGLMSAFNIISAEFNNLSTSNSNEYVQNVAANSQEVANTLGSKLIDRAMDVQPTLTIPLGKKINIVANTTLTLPPFEDFPVTEPYHR